MRRWIWYLAKGFEGIGLLVILWGLLLSIQLGMGDEGLESMKVESYALGIGVALFVVGWLMERQLGTR